jgi:hypothetical protein
MLGEARARRAALGCNPGIGRLMRIPACLLVMLVLSGCLTTAVEVDEEAEFPVPLVPKIPLNMGVHLPQELLDFVHREDLGDDGIFTIDISDAQPTVFKNLFTGMFETVTLIDNPSQPGADVAGTIVPRITEMQFSTPYQTRTDYFEVWLRYQFELYDRDGSRLGDWDLTAYGKANTQNYGLNTTPPTLRAAALQACRDAMAFFTISFVREPTVQRWLTAELAAERTAAAQPATSPAAAQNVHGGF